MTRMSPLAASLALALGLGFAPIHGAALAQTAAPAAPAAAAPPAPAAKGAKPRTAKSLACSADADKQNLHGKPRKTFMSKCKAGKA